MTTQNTVFIDKKGLDMAYTGKRKYKYDEYGNRIVVSSNLVNRTPIPTTLDNDLMAWLRTTSEETEVPMSRLFDRAVRLLKENMEK